ncbi:hypothetical protein C2845_PM14G02710 [Panicum miliaceum]|uniref:Uncharacterized protein n=1 Tax=Panicum miliaceum TaxID=4540 RepID=A0A3L6PTU7_PANMI|nr:hypothetical protein C2845_PM14G02710 [Panicum miliaceum]
MATLMMESRRSSQGFLLLPLLLLACSAIPGLTSGDRAVRDASGESFLDGGGRKSKMAIGAGKAAVINDDGDAPFNGCTPHDRASKFCCNKNKRCWATLYDCALNCIRKVRCDQASPSSSPSPSMVDPRLAVSSLFKKL